jgi:hypothetical protein
MSVYIPKPHTSSSSKKKIKVEKTLSFINEIMRRTLYCTLRCAMITPLPEEGKGFFLFYFCQFTIYLTVKKVISKCDTNVRLGGGNCPTAVLTHLIC